MQVCVCVCVWFSLAVGLLQGVVVQGLGLLGIGCGALPFQL